MKHLDRDLERLRREILDVGTRVETALKKALGAYLEQDMVLGQDVIEGDKIIDAMEVEVEEECLKILALHQPVAADLRYVVTCLKVNNDLERIGDLAANIAGRAIALSGRSGMKAPSAVVRMSRIASQMVRDSFKALLESDTELAHQVLEADDELDDLHRRNMQGLIALMIEAPESVESASQHMSVSRNLERIGDLSTNIGEDVVFLVDGEVIRHGLGGQNGGF